MEFDEHEDEMEEPEDIPPLQSHHPGYAAAGGDAAATSSASRKPTGGGHFRYRECLKNHAVGIGGNAVDGCGEFMPAGEEGTLDALRCAACGCHRNFHRRESEPEVGIGGSLVYHHFSPYYRAAQPPSGYLHVTPATLHRPLALPAASGGGRSREELEADVSNPSSSGGGGGGRRLMKMKRSRTKFTAEQKEKMQGFAERVGWRLQRHDEAEVERFCEETGVKRHVLKVWMHNNKNTFGKKTTTT